ncbi:hypothetical protein N431DRAFT_461125 [Stipitochalara longipes BDJ]|nr:hypothetical protein N431DRAFT_461125 [Stipitochalara longipes BDJ]
MYRKNSTLYSASIRGANSFVAREAYRHLNVSGRIILMSSNTAKDLTVPKHSVYASSKGTTEYFVRVFSKDCGDTRITVNAVAPGGTVADIFNDLSQHHIPSGQKYTAKERQEMVAHVSPLNQNRFPVDIARVVCLASNKAEWIMGKS